MAVMWKGLPVARTDAAMDHMLLIYVHLVRFYIDPELRGFEAIRAYRLRSVVFKLAKWKAEHVWQTPMAKTVAASTAM